MQTKDNTGVYWAVTAQLPQIGDDGNPVLVDGNAVYEKNYFCNAYTAPGTDVKVNEWDTDERYAMRFVSETAANNFSKICGVEGTTVEHHPGNIKVKTIYNHKKQKENESKNETEKQP